VLHINSFKHFVQNLMSRTPDRTMVVRFHPKVVTGVIYIDSPLTAKEKEAKYYSAEEIEKFHRFWKHISLKEQLRKRQAAKLQSQVSRKLTLKLHSRLPAHEQQGSAEKKPAALPRRLMAGQKVHKRPAAVTRPRSPKYKLPTPASHTTSTHGTRNGAWNIVANNREPSAKAPPIKKRCVQNTGMTKGMSRTSFSGR
jgi:hypothetical protein